MLPMFFSNKYPYTDFHELNLDWIINQLKQMSIELEKFVSLNTIKYADPIQWDITRQYETNTIVIDPNTGTAYISVQPVPSGVALTNTDYWTVVFSLDINKSNENITLRNDENNTNATFESVAGDWLLVSGTLYKVTSTIDIGDTYVPNYNIVRYTVEQYIKDYIDGVISLIGDLNDLSTTDKTSIVNAINEVVTSLTTVISNVGDLNDLTTTDKSSLVNAINEVKKYGGIFINVKSYGATGDGVTDDTTAIRSAIADIGVNNYILYFPGGTYVVSAPLTMPTNSGIICGDGRMLSTIELQDNTGFIFTSAKGIEIHSIGICNKTQATNPYHAIDLLNNTLRVNIYDMFFNRNYVDIYMNSAVTEVLINGITSFNWTRSSILTGDIGYCGSINVINSFFKTEHGIVTNGAIEIKYTDVMNVHGNTLITPMSNNVLIEPESGQTASLLTFDGNCFDTSENGLQCRGSGRITRLIINGNTVQEMDTTGILLNNANMDYVVITDNVMFNTPYNVNIAEACVIEDCNISHNVFTGDTLALRLAGTTSKLLVNENIIGTSRYGLTMANGIVAVPGIEGSAYGNVFNNVTTPIQNNSPDFTIYDYLLPPTPPTPTDPRVRQNLSVTTDGNGNAILTGFNDNSIDIIKVLNLQGDFILNLYWDNTNTNWYINVLDAVGSPVVSTTFNIEVTYIGSWS